MSKLKFKLTEKTTTTPCKITVYQIVALVDIEAHNVKAGDVGGFVELEDNLSHHGDCWVADKAMVYSFARVTGNALISDKAQVYDDAQVGESASVRGASEVYGDAMVGEYACIEGASHVFDYASVFGRAVVSDSSQLYGNVKIAGDTCVAGAANITVGTFSFDIDAPALTDVAFPSENHLRDSDHPRYDERLTTFTY